MLTHALPVAPGPDDPAAAAEVERFKELATALRGLRARWLVAAADRQRARNLDVGALLSRRGERQRGARAVAARPETE